MKTWTPLIKSNIDKKERFEILSRTVQYQRKIFDGKDFLKSVKKLNEKTFIEEQKNFWNNQKIYWEDLKTPDEFNKLKKILEK